MRKLLDKLAELLLQPVSQAVTVLLATYTILWGIWVANPFVNTFTSAQLYSVLAEFIPSEIVWGLFAIVFGILTLWGARRTPTKEGYVGAAAAGLHWFIISLFYFAGDIANTGGITAAFLAFLSGYLYLNLKINYLKDHEEEGL